MELREFLNNLGQEGKSLRGYHTLMGEVRKY